MICPRCGANCSNNERFCYKCGFSLSVQPPKAPDGFQGSFQPPQVPPEFQNPPQMPQYQQTQYQQYAPQPQPVNNQPNAPKKKKNGAKLVIAILALLVVIALCVGGFILAKDKLAIKNDITADVDAIYENMLSDLDSMSYDEQLEQVEKTIDELDEQGLIKKDTVEYYEAGQIYCFEFSNGSLGGISLKDYNEELNMSSSDSQAGEVDKSLYKVDQHKQNAIILNGFEDEPYRRDYYKDLEKDWERKGVNTVVDTSVTVQELKLLTDFDIVVLSMHGVLYKEVPSIVINQIVSAENNAKNKNEIKSQTVVKVKVKDSKRQIYLVLPEFFEQNYRNKKLNAQIVFAECCDFFGDDIVSTTPDYTFANVMDNISDGAIIGYHNIVGAGYSRDVMKITIEAMMDGKSADKALKKAKKQCGNDDDWEDFSEKPYKYKAYPILIGEKEQTAEKVDYADAAVELIYNMPKYGFNSGDTAISIELIDLDGNNIPEIVYCNHFGATGIPGMSGIFKFDGKKYVEADLSLDEDDSTFPIIPRRDSDDNLIFTSQLLDLDYIMDYDASYLSSSFWYYHTSGVSEYKFNGNTLSDEVLYNYSAYRDQIWENESDESIVQNEFADYRKAVSNFYKEYEIDNFYKFTCANYIGVGYIDNELSTDERLDLYHKTMTKEAAQALVDAYENGDQEIDLDSYLLESDY